MNYLMLVNKKNGLSQNYVPGDLVKVETKTGGNKIIFLERKTYKQIQKLLNDMNKLFLKEIVIDSGYRSFSYQSKLMDDLIKEKGNDAYKSLALPGYSEHQTGLAVDIGFYQDGKYDDKFDINNYEKEFQWLQNNAYKYGFIVRYPKDKEDITGYIYEPWHLRYLGPKASFLHHNNLTLEEYYENLKI